MIINFENSASHKYVVQTAITIFMVDQKWLGIHFLLSRNHINSILKSLVPNSCRLVTPKINPVLIMASVWPPEISSVYDQIPNTSETVYEALL